MGIIYNSAQNCPSPQEFLHGNAVSIDRICNWGMIGGAIVGLWHKSHSQGGDETLRIELAKLQSEKEAQADKEEWIKNAEEKLREAFDSLAGKSLRHNAEAFLKQAQTQMTGVLNEVRGDWKTQKSEMQNLMTPVRENLDKLDGHVRSLEEKREGAYQALGQQLKELMKYAAQTSDHDRHIV